ncbi:hypothetical protein G4X40_10510 [Rhodococcus sp. D2-41]|uniref:Uncharacterized protein n=1 Tax=Speluncibacter jeojiensis TaxID=2710754 RepID=A0A9X4M335_9ACTN|nr:hypothetical protein [Rhodococcus sp. D2-41]MDG3010580.1 hypothetical protein [Rhodococcus sp. D2-41]MDG3014328.1 hypothetical protein [Corynebacteriales bacterium D3-21]
MTPSLVVPASLGRAAAVFGTAVVALVLAAMSALAWPGAAHAATSGLEYSTDGVAWSAVAPLGTGGAVVLAPGQESTTTLQVRNTSNQITNAGFFLKSYTMSPGSSAYFRADVNGVAGQTKTASQGPIASPNAVLAWVPLNPNQSATVSLVVGVPSGAALPSTISVTWGVGTTGCSQPGLGSSGVSLQCLVTGDPSKLLTTGSTGA